VPEYKSTDVIKLCVPLSVTDFTEQPDRISRGVIEILALKRVGCDAWQKPAALPRPSLSVVDFISCIGTFSGFHRGSMLGIWASFHVTLWLILLNPFLIQYISNDSVNRAFHPAAPGIVLVLYIIP
jgi:hypothetical protein